MALIGIDRHARGPARSSPPTRAGGSSSTRACARTAAGSASRAGFWLPECAYEPGLERLLAEHGLGFFCTDQSAHEPPDAAMRPIATDAGPVALPIDWEAVSWLWSFEGYPSDPAHTDFHRESLRGARVWSIGGEHPRSRRGRGARARAGHASSSRQSRTGCAHHRERTGSDGLVVFAIDTELLGHWWWEGPEWLAEVVGGADRRRGRAGDAAGGGRSASSAEPRTLHRSSWGEHKDLSTWDSPDVADLAWGARRLELRLAATRSRRAALSAAAAERARA